MIKYFKLILLYLSVLLSFSSVLSAPSPLIEDICDGEEGICKIISPITKILVNLYQGIRTESPFVDAFFIVVLVVCLVPVYSKLLQFGFFRGRDSHSSRARNTLSFVLSVITISGFVMFVPKGRSFLGYWGAIAMYLVVLGISLGAFIMFCLWAYRNLWDEDNMRRKLVVSVLFSLGFIFVSAATSWFHKELFETDQGVSVGGLINWVQNVVATIEAVSFIVFFVSLLGLIFFVLSSFGKGSNESVEEEVPQEEESGDDRKVRQLNSILEMGVAQARGLREIAQEIRNSLNNIQTRVSRVRGNISQDNLTTMLGEVNNIRHNFSVMMQHTRKLTDYAENSLGGVVKYYLRIATRRKNLLEYIEREQHVSPENKRLFEASYNMNTGQENILGDLSTHVSQNQENTLYRIEDSLNRLNNNNSVDVEKNTIVTNCQNLQGHINSIINICDRLLPEEN